MRTHGDDLRATTQRAPSLSGRPVRAWLFDIDGVLTDPESKRVGDVRILDEIVWRLGLGEPVGANTGRSLRFAEDRLLEPLEGRVLDVALLRNLFVVGDKGGAWLTYGEDGQRMRFLDKALVTEEVATLLADVKRLVEDRYSDNMFVDETKETMVTIEMNDGMKVDDFRPAQADAVLHLDALLKDRGLHEDFRVDPTRIAIDVERKTAGKALGARRILAMLEERGICPSEYIAFGDSPSDFDMAEELHRLGKRVQFVYVGGFGSLDGRDSGTFPVVYTQGLFDKGTVEFLQSYR
jgi:hydroxymethylpyrimidine pyrophosphatase-like HAD family hydrolase